MHDRSSVKHHVTLIRFLCVFAPSRFDLLDGNLPDGGPLDGPPFQCYSNSIDISTREARLPILTLLTDFGLRDGYSGVLKGVIWSILPDAQVADLSHTISPQNIVEGALALARTAFFFPDGTVHVAVVDPGVGTRRRPIALRLGSHFFVGPDNGLFTLVLERAESEGWPVEAVQLDNPAYWLPEISRVFHGRDIFSPVAAHIAGGVPLEKVGSPIDDPVRLEIPRPIKIGTGMVGPGAVYRLVRQPGHQPERAATWTAWVRSPCGLPGGRSAGWCRPSATARPAS